MKKTRRILVDIEIDKLTNSIENTVSGDIFDTSVVQLFTQDGIKIKKTEWRFDWKQQLKLTDRQIYKLIIEHNPKYYSRTNKFK